MPTYHRLLFTSIAACLALFSNGQLPHALAQMSPLEAEQEALRFREQIHSLHLVMTVEHAVRIQGRPELLPLSPLNRRDVTKVWMDGESVRFDRASQGVRIELPDGTQGRPMSKDGSVEMRVVSTPQRSLHFMATPLANSPTPAVRVVEAPKPSQDELVRMMISDVRMLGMIPMPSALMYRTPVEKFVGRQERSDATLVPERLGEIDTLKSIYRRDDGKSVALWLAPAMQYGIVQAEFWMDYPDGGRRMQRVTSKLKEYNAGIWFPSEIEYMCFQDDKRIEHARTTINDAVFNVPIDPAIFTLEGLQMEPGTIVMNASQRADDDDSRLHVWNGAKLADLPQVSPPAAGPPPPGPQPQTEKRWILWLNLTAAAVCMALYVRAKRRASKD